MANAIINSLDKVHGKLCEILSNKNADYSAGKGEFFNFELASSISGVSVEKGIMVRLADKMSRISGLLDGNAPAVKDEKIEDTILDAIGYLVILKAYLNREVDWQKESIIDGVKMDLEGGLTPEQSRENWVEFKAKDGREYGPVKDPKKKEHPCMVPYDKLSKEQ